MFSPLFSGALGAVHLLGVSGESCTLGCVLRDAAGCVQELKERHRHVMQAMLMDVLRALATPNMDIRKKTLDIALDLITQHNIDEVRAFLILHLADACFHAIALLRSGFHRYHSVAASALIHIPCTLTEHQVHKQAL